MYGPQSGANKQEVRIPIFEIVPVVPRSAITPIPLPILGEGLFHLVSYPGYSPHPHAASPFASCRRKQLVDIGEKRRYFTAAIHGELFTISNASSQGQHRFRERW